MDVLLKEYQVLLFIVSDKFWIKQNHRCPKLTMRAEKISVQAKYILHRQTLKIVYNHATKSLLLPERRMIRLIDASLFI